MRVMHGLFSDLTTERMCGRIKTNKCSMFGIAEKSESYVFGRAHEYTRKA